MELDDGPWTMELDDGQWTMDNGRWTMEKHVGAGLVPAQKKC